MAFPRKLALFALAGAIGFVADVLILYLVKGMTGPYLGRVFSFAGAVLTTYLINRNVTFAAQADGAARWHGFRNYVAAMLGGGAVNYALYAALVTWVGLVAAIPALGVAAGSLAGMGVNFVLSDKWVFRSRA